MTMTPGQGFGDRLAQAMRQYGPLCVGVDPHATLLQRWGLDNTAQGAEKFSLSVLEAAQGHAAVIKPQVAFFERFGSAGIAVLERLLVEARSADVLVIADAKRGDIGSTMAAYAETWLGENSPLGTDSVTVSPYLGFESLRPAFDTAQQQNRGTFVLALTSNPEGQTVQHVGGTDSVVAGIIADAERENAREKFTDMGSCGLVIGATVGDALKKLEIDLSSFNGPILAPGYGAQGATAQSLYDVFAGSESQILVNSSREILRHGPRVEDLTASIKSHNETLLGFII